MLEYLILGTGLGFTAGIQPGLLQAFFLASVAKHGWPRTLPAALAPLLSDGPIALLILFVLNRVPATATQFLRAAGGILLLYLGWSSFRQWLQPTEDTQPRDGKAPSTLLQAAAVNILNPASYLGWSLVLGPTFLKAWRESPGNGIAFVAAFYATMLIVNAVIITLLGTTRFLGTRARRTLVLVSAIALAILGAYQLVSVLLAALVA
jgi:threonine/homoserine/homoserine lactone efflux protein